MTKRTDAVMHQQFSMVFGEELKNHGIGVREFMMSCAIKHDYFMGVKKVLTWN